MAGHPTMAEEGGGDGANDIEAVTSKGGADDDDKVKTAATSTAGVATSATPTETTTATGSRRVYRHGDLAAGDRLIHSYAADRTPGSATLYRQGFCVGFSFPRGGGRASQQEQPGQPEQQQQQQEQGKSEEQQPPKVKLLLDNGQHVSVKFSSVRRLTHKDEVIYGGHPDDESIWGFAELLKFENSDDISMTEGQQQHQQRSAALRRKRLELEVAQKKRSLLARKREREEALLAAAHTRKRQKGSITDLAALRRPTIVVRGISSAGPRELVHIQQQEEDTDAATTTDKTRLPTPQREEKKSELRQRQREVLERKAELMRKAEVLKNKKKRKSLDTADGDDNGDDDGDDGNDAKKRAADDSGTSEDAVELGILRSGAASEAENNNDDVDILLLEDADPDADADQLEQLRLRRLELQSAISQQAQTQTQLKQSIEVQSLRGMVRAQLGVLTKQGQNLSERTTQLKQCTADIEAERKEVEDAERRLEELLDKKQRLGVMAGRVTEQLLESRKRRADLLEVAGGSSTTAGDVKDSIGEEGPDAVAGDTSSDKSRRLSKGQRKRRSAGWKRKDAASDFFEE